MTAVAIERTKLRVTTLVHLQLLHRVNPQPVLRVLHSLAVRGHLHLPLAQHFARFPQLFLLRRHYFLLGRLSHGHGQLLGLLQSFLLSGIRLLLRWLLLQLLLVLLDGLFLK